jgi:hypothetical protein
MLLVTPPAKKRAACGEALCYDERPPTSTTPILAKLMSDEIYDQLSAAAA